MRKLILAALALAAVVACTGDSPTGPVAQAPAATRNTYPGSHRTRDALSGKFVPANCTPKNAAEGTALIGPRGGVLNIGTHRLIIPAGALDRTVQISGSVPAGKPFEVDLQPHGLRFRKAAGLILDATSCTDVPPIVYLIDQYTVTPPIPAFYSNWWKAIACPIWHFSGYMVAFESGGYEVGAE
jgi:hypothetical protein